MKRSLIYIAVFSAMMMVTGCGGGESNSTNDVTTQISEKRDLTYTTDEDGNYYLDFSEMKSDAKAIIQTSGKFYTYDEYRKEGTYGDQDGLKTYYNEKNIINFEYLANNVVKADIFDRKNGFVKRVFTVIRNGELYAQETTDVDVINIDESKPLILHSGVINEINKIIDVVDPLPTTASSTLAKGINFSFFPTAYAAGYGVAERTYREDRFGAALGVIAIGFALGELAVVGTAAATFVAFPVILPIAIGVLGTIVFYEKNEKFRNFLDNTFDDLKKGPTNLLNNLVNVLIPNANASEEEIKYWKKLLEEERKKCLASGMKLINGICKKEEEPQCLADEILVNGICKKKEPICATDEILVNGVCQKIEEKFSGIYKLTFHQTSCTENERTCSFGSDKNIGTLYLYPNKKDGILAVLEGYVSGGAYGYGVKWNLDKNSIEFNNDGFKIKGVRNIMLDSNGSNIVKRDVYVNFKISKENLINKVWSGVWTFDFIDKEQLSYDSKNNIYYYVEKSGKATGTWSMSPFNIKKLPAFTPEISGVCHNSGYIYNFVDAIELSRGADAVLISDNVNKSCTYYQDVYN